jgi:hypothetical protein
MGYIQAVINALKGKKAYILSAVIVIEGLLTGDWNRVLEGLTAASLRAGISKK